VLAHGSRVCATSLPPAMRRPWSRAASPPVLATCCRR